ncbi:hypothetical protein G6F64_013789 [Rhizopus arrhizus]|uniref:Uncharacterized protein n=1 Tax=Rhizopus oryzae TaxID=64495 RepID=A0A9P7BJK7_RHIOR|nr:hypothetical protein G6F64_013789 [Rhizopus arrhizus]
MIATIGDLKNAPGRATIQREIQCHETDATAQQADQEHVQHHAGRRRQRLRGVSAWPQAGNRHGQRSAHKNQHHRHRNRSNTRHQPTCSIIHPLHGRSVTPRLQARLQHRCLTRRFAPAAHPSAPAAHAGCLRPKASAAARVACS